MLKPPLKQNAHQKIRKRRFFKKKNRCWNKFGGGVFLFSFDHFIGFDIIETFLRFLVSQNMIDTSHSKMTFMILTFYLEN